VESLFIGKHIIHLESVSSTNEYALEALKKGKVSHGSLISADFQESGKGQRGKKWESEKAKNLLLSYVLTPKNFAAEKSFELNFVCALAVVDFLKFYLPNTEVHIKWPNDLMLNHKKVAGILIENSLQSGNLKQAILGIGINVNQEVFKSPFATSMVNESKNTLNLAKCILTLNSLLEKWLFKMNEGKLAEILTTYNLFLWKKNKPIEAKLNGELTALEILNVDRFGLIYIKTINGYQKAELGELKIGYEK